MMDFNETIRYPMGVLYLNLIKIMDIDLPDNTFIRITFEPYKIETRSINKALKGDEIHQKFYLPIHNHFNELILDIVFVENEGWFREKRKEQTIASICLPIPHLHEMVKKEGSDLIKIPFKCLNKKLYLDIMKGKYRKQEKFQSSDMTKEEKLKEQQSIEKSFEVDRHLEVEIHNYTSINSLYAFHMNRNRTENRIMDGSYGLKKYQEVIWRLKLCSLSFEKFKNAQRFIFYHNYPKFSFYCEICIVLFVWLFKSDHLLSYALIALILILLINGGVMNEQINNFFFTKENRNKMISDSDINTQQIVDEKLVS
jgi:hypothetical protein